SACCSAPCRCGPGCCTPCSSVTETGAFQATPGELAIGRVRGIWSPGSRGSEMSQYVADGSAPVLIERYEQLVEFFASACKPRANWRIGTEYEKVAVWAASGA